MAIMFLDLDGFKEINDTLGHSLGDMLLQQASKKLKSCIREEDILARYGGDEFIVILEDIDIEKIAGVAQRIIREFHAPFLLETHEVNTSPSIGVSIYPKDGNDEITLINNADTAMYIAKKRGKNNYEFYNPGLEKENLKVGAEK